MHPEAPHSAKSFAAMALGIAACLHWMPVMAAVADDVRQALGQLSGSTAAVADHLAVTAESLRIREAAGEIGAPERQRALQAAVAQIRSPTGGATPSATKRERHAAAQRLIAAAESRVATARWPTDLPAAIYRERARVTMQNARIRFAYLSGLDVSLVYAVTPAAEVLGWTQGRLGGGAIFDGLDGDIEAATRGVFANLPRPTGTVAAGAPASTPQPPMVAQQPPAVTQQPPAARQPPAAAMPPPTGGTTATAEYGIDGQTLQGNAFSVVGGPGTTSAQCKSACETDASCAGWVLVKPGYPSPGCYVTATVTNRIANPCCRSEVKAGQVGSTAAGSTAAAATPTITPNTPYDNLVFNGQTLRYFPRGTSQECNIDCQRDPNCRGWTWVKPGGYKAGDAAMCYLVARIDAQVPHACCISAIKGATGGAPAVPPARATPVQAVAFVGCYKDTNDFDLKGYIERSAANTPQRCIAICQAKGFAFAGVQYSESCLCGNTYGRYGAAANCNMPCTGDRGQTCGGYASNSVYSTGVNAAAGNVTPPAPPVATPPASSGNWTAWISRDIPDGTADWEALSEMRGQVPCAKPIAIECRVVSDKRDWRQTGQRYRCSLDEPNPGGTCVNADNPSGGCLDYEVRYLCPAR